MQSETQEQKSILIKANEKDPLSLAICLLEECPAMIRCNKALYQFNGRCYDLVTENDLFTMFYGFIIQHGIVMAWKLRRDVVAAINASTSIKSIQQFNDYPNLICLENCIFNIHTKEQIPHSVDYYFDSYVNVSPLAIQTECPNFMKYLNDTFNGDQDTIENIIRIGGYLLDPTCKAGKMFLFNGNGGSGKSTLLDTFQLFFSPDQVSPLSLDEIASGSFDKEMLIKSRLNVTAEGRKSFLEVQEINKIVTGDLIKVSRKFQLPVSFRPKLKIIVACNGLPRFNDTSDGIYRRLILIEFPNQYRSKEEIARNPRAEYLGLKEKDYELFDKITEEKNAIFDLFIEGLKRLKANKYEFVFSLLLDNLLLNFKKDSDTVREFLEDNYDIDTHGEIPLLDIYDHYRIWYRQNVQDSTALKLRANEMGKRIKEVFGLNPAGRHVTRNVTTGQAQNLSFYRLKLKDMEEADIDFDTTEAVTQQQAGLGL